MRSFPAIVLIVTAGILGCFHMVEGGMPAALPTDWVLKDGKSTWETGGMKSRTGGEAEWQAISFFGATILLSGWGFKRLWNGIRRDVPTWPKLTYGRSISLVLLWGACCIVVLTMISGARELMTPGAWKKRGATYTLADSEPERTDQPKSLKRKAAMERLRFALWQYAAVHEGRMPERESSEIASDLWEVTGEPGMRFLYVSGKSAGKEGEVLAFEPEIDPQERVVLLTNGLVGTMRTSELESHLRGERASEREVKK